MSNRIDFYNDNMSLSYFVLCRVKSKHNTNKQMVTGTCGRDLTVEASSPFEKQDLDKEEGGG